jgi:hypothetical protein
MAYGTKLSEDSNAVRYTFGPSPSDVRGVLVVPVDDMDSWFVEQATDRPMHARWVFSTIYRLWRSSGTWPEVAAFYS